MKQVVHPIAVLVAGLALTTAAGVSAQTVAPVALPYDAKTHHSSECQPQFWTQAASLVYWEHGLLNNGGGAMQVVCPIVRDNTSNKTGTFGATIYITNVANNQFACSLYSYDRYNTLQEESIASTTTGGKQPLSVSVSKSLAEGHYSLRCLMPFNAKLHSYTVKERLDGVNRTDFGN